MYRFIADCRGKRFLSQCLQFVLFDSGNFHEQELNPDSAKKTYKAFITSKYFFAQIPVLDGFGRKTHDIASQPSLSQTLECLLVELFHFPGLRNDGNRLVTRLDQVHSCHKSNQFNLNLRKGVEYPLTRFKLMFDDNILLCPWKQRNPGLGPGPFFDCMGSGFGVIIAVLMA